MKKISRILAVFTAAVMTMTSVCITVSADTGNLITNGNASNGLSGWTDPDGAWASDTSSTQPGWSSFKPYDGAYFWPKKKKLSQSRLYQDISVKKYTGMKATLSAYVRQYNDGDECKLMLEFLDSSGKVIDSASTTKSKSSDKWTNISVSKTVPKNAVTTRVSLYGIRHGGSDCDSYFDNVSLTMSGTPSSSDSSDSSDSSGSSDSNTSTKDNMFRIYLEEGESLKVAAIIGGKAASSVKYSSSNSKISKVTSNGKIKATSAGTAIITAKSGSTVVKIQVLVEEDD